MIVSAECVSFEFPMLVHSHAHDCYIIEANMYLANINIKLINIIGTNIFNPVWESLF